MTCLFSPLTVAGLYHGDSRDVLKTLPDNSIDSVVTDPPYALVSIVKRFGGKNAAPAKSNGASGVYARASAGFMGQSWDTGEVAFAAEFWSEVYRVLKPGGHVVSFGGTRTYHRMAVAIEDAGFEIRDQIQWLYGTGFPKSHDVSKAIDKSLGGQREMVKPRSVIGHQRDIGNRRPYMDDPNHMTVSDIPATPEAEQWEGWGTALKPANEPICLARKPLEGTVAENVLKWGTGAINIDGCRVEYDEKDLSDRISRTGSNAGKQYGAKGNVSYTGGELAPVNNIGRFPANVLTDGSVEMPNGAQRFFYSAKASKVDRNSGLENIVEIVLEYSWENEDRKVSLLVEMGTSHPRVTYASITEVVSEWNMMLFGNWKTDQSRKDSTSITRTELKQIIVSKILNFCQSLDTRESIQDASKSTENGTNLVENAGRFTLNLHTTSEKMGFLLGVDRAASSTQLSVNVTVKDFESSHPTVKPTELMQYLCRLVTPPGGVVLDPFMGSGSTGKAARLEGFRFVGIEREEAYFKIAQARCA